MAENSLPQVSTTVNVNGLSFIDYQGKVFFSSEEIGRQLGYAKPSKSVNILFNRNQRELESYATGIKLMQVDGCFREVRCFTEEGVYIISMLASTPRAQDFRARLARLLREIRENRLELAREAAYQQGRDEALSLPAVQAERKAGYLEGLKEGRRLQKQQDGLTQLRRIAAYLTKGLSYTDIGKLIGVSKSAVARRVQAARKLGVML